MSQWRRHDSYKPGVSTSRIVTRSQSCFLRVEKTISNLNLFADPKRHQIPNAPHLMSVMKGIYGSIPQTIITRSTGRNFSITKELNDALKPYKEFNVKCYSAPQDVLETTQGPDYKLKRYQDIKDELESFGRDEEEMEIDQEFAAEQEDIEPMDSGESDDVPVKAVYGVLVPKVLPKKMSIKEQTYYDSSEDSMRDRKDSVRLEMRHPTTDKDVSSTEQDADVVMKEESHLTADEEKAATVKDEEDQVKEWKDKTLATRFSDADMKEQERSNLIVKEEEYPMNINEGQTGAIMDEADKNIQELEEKLNGKIKLKDIDSARKKEENGESVVEVQTDGIINNGMSAEEKDIVVKVEEFAKLTEEGNTTVKENEGIMTAKTDVYETEQTEQEDDRADMEIEQTKREDDRADMETEEEKVIEKEDDAAEVESQAKEGESNVLTISQNGSATTETFVQFSGNEDYDGMNKEDQNTINVCEKNGVETDKRETDENQKATDCGEDKCDSGYNRSEDSQGIS